MKVCAMLKRIAPLVLTLLVLSCGSDDDDRNPAVKGRVLDGSGLGLGGVGIVVSYHVPFLPDFGDTVITEVVTTDANRFTLSMPETDNLLLTVHDRWSGAVEDTVYYGLVETGTWSIEWDYRDAYERVITGGMKVARIQTSWSVANIEFLFNPDYESVDSPYVWLAETNDQGRFELDETDLAFRWQHLFSLLDEDNDLAGVFQLSRRLRIYAVNEFGILAESGLVELDEIEDGIDLVVPIAVLESARP